MQQQADRKAAVIQRKKDIEYFRQKDAGTYVDPAHKATKEKLVKLGYKIWDIAGGSFPDGDPIDLLGPYVRRNFGPRADVVALLDKGLAAIGDKGGYYKYLADMWDDISADQPELGLGQNPWK